MQLCRCWIYGRIVYLKHEWWSALFKIRKILYMRQNVCITMCISRCSSLVSCSLSLLCTRLLFGFTFCDCVPRRNWSWLYVLFDNKILWPTYTISLIYCNGFKLCELQYNFSIAMRSIFLIHQVISPHHTHTPFIFYLLKRQQIKSIAFCCKSLMRTSLSSATGTTLYSTL